jgi:hypothetical protein
MVSIRSFWFVLVDKEFKTAIPMGIHGLFLKSTRQ